MTNDHLTHEIEHFTMTSRRRPTCGIYIRERFDLDLIRQLQNAEVVTNALGALFFAQHVGFQIPYLTRVFLAKRTSKNEQTFNSLQARGFCCLICRNYVGGRI